LVVLQVLGILLSALSAGIAISNTVFFRLNPRLGRRDDAYYRLMTENELTDRGEIRHLLEFTRRDIARIADNPEFSKYGAMRNWKEVVRLVCVPGKIDQRQEYSFAVMHPIYGYNEKGEERMVVGLREFHYLYSNRVRALQQNQAYAVLVFSLIIQFLGIFSPF
jgi:hypothetical protein